MGGKRTIISIAEEFSTKTTTKKMQCEIKLILCDNETMRIIYENNVVPVPFSACCTCPFYPLFFFRKKNLLLVLSFHRLYPWSRICTFKDKSIWSLWREEKNDRMKHATKTRAWLQKQLQTLTLCDRTLRDENKI